MSNQNAGDVADERTLLLSRGNGEGTFGGSEQLNVLSEEEMDMETPRARTRRMQNLLVSILILLLSSLLFLRALRVRELKEELSQSANLELTGISLGSVYDKGIEVIIDGRVSMDYTTVKGDIRQGIVTAVSDFLHIIHVETSTVAIYLVKNNEDNSSDEQKEEEELTRAVCASLPSFDISIRPGEETNLTLTVFLHDFASAYVMGTIVKRLLSDESISFAGVTDIALKKWGINVGPLQVKIRQTLQSDISIPKFDIFGLSIDEAADNGDLMIYARISALYDYPLRVDIPSTIWELRVEGCPASNTTVDHILVTKSRVTDLTLEPNSIVEAGVSSRLKLLPFQLFEPCSDGSKSALDYFIDNYLLGIQNNIYIKGALNQDDIIPNWFAELISAISFQAQFDGLNNTEQLLKRVKFNNMRLEISDISHESMKDLNDPHFGADVQVTTRPPNSIHISPEMYLEADWLKGTGDLFYEGDEFAKVYIEDWVPCETSLGDPDDPEEQGCYNIDFTVESIPLDVTNQNVFGKVIKQTIFNGEALVHIKTVMDVQVNCAIGGFIVSGLEIEGDSLLGRG